MKSRKVTSFDLRKEKHKDGSCNLGRGRKRDEKEKEKERKREGGRQWERKDSREKDFNLTHFLATTVEYGVSFLSPSM